MPQGFSLFCRTLDRRSERRKGRCWQKIGKQLVIWWVIISFSGTLWGPWAMEASADSAVQRSLSPPQVAAPPTPGPSRFKPSHHRSLSRPQSSSQHPLPQHPQHESPISLEQDFLLPKRPRYQPYLEIGGVKYSGSGGNIAGVAELFIPVVESKQRLMFLDLRIFDRKGGAFEGNIQVGYRQFFEEQEQLVGLYGGWDRKKSEYGGYFNQLMGGMEYWWRNWFIGGNIYHPLGKSRRLVSEESWSKTKTKLEEVDDGVYRYRETMISGKKSLHKEALSGWDGEIGYAINEELTGYLGGYYFKGERGGRISGPRARISYEYGMKAGRILGIIDGLKVELGAQKDQERGGKIYLGVRIRIGLGGERKGGQLQGLERHMEDSIRRDPDIVVERDEKREEEQRRVEFVELGGRRKKEDPREKLRRLLREFGVEEGAGWQQVRERYREYARQYHPDRPHNHSRSRESSRKFGHYQGLYGKLEGFAEELKQRDQVAEYVARGEVKTEPRAGGASEGGGIKTEPRAGGEFRGETGAGGGTGTDSQGESSECESESERARWLRWVRARESGAEEKAGPSAEGWLAVPTPAPTPIKIRGQTHNLTRWLAPPAGTPNVTINATIPLNSPVANPIANPVLKLVDGLLAIIWPIREVGAQVDPGEKRSKVMAALMEKLIGELVPQSEREKNVGSRTNYHEEELLAIFKPLELAAQKLSENQLNFLMTVLQLGGAGWGWRVLESMVTILIKQVTRYERDVRYGPLLFDLAKSDGLIRKEMIGKFATESYTTQRTQWFNGWLFDSFAELLPMDSDNQLAHILIYANQFHGYQAPIKVLNHFNQLLGGDLRGCLLALISSSLTGYWSVTRSEDDFTEITNYFRGLLVAVDKLPVDLWEIIFEVFRRAPRYLAKEVVDRLAEDRQLAVGLLNKLVGSDQLVTPLEKLEDPKVALFLALRLVQHQLLLREAILQHCIRLGSTRGKGVGGDTKEGENSEANVSGTRVLLVKLFHQLGKEIPAGVGDELADELIGIYAEVGSLVRSQIDEVLGKINLTEGQRSRVEIQKWVVTWQEAKDREQKEKLGEQLFQLISDKRNWDGVRGREELQRWLREQLASRNRKQLERARGALISFNGGAVDDAKLGLNKEEQEILAGLVTLESWQGKLFGKIHKITVGEDEFLLNGRQWKEWQGSFKKISRRNQDNLKRINCDDFRKIREFIEFLWSKDVSEEELARVLKRYPTKGLIDLGWIYREVLNDLVAEIRKEQGKEGKRLESSVKDLVDKMGWSASFLIKLLKRVKGGREGDRWANWAEGLNKLADYQVSLRDQVDRYGRSVEEILSSYIQLATQQSTMPGKSTKNEQERGTERSKVGEMGDLLSAIDRLIRDNHFYPSRELTNLLEEFKIANRDNEKLKRLLEEGYFERQIKRIMEIRKDWLGSKYQVEVREDEIFPCEERKIYLYKSGDGFGIASASGRAGLGGLRGDELGRIGKVFDNQLRNEGKLLDNRLVYEYAVRLKLAPKLRGIAKRLPEWKREAVEGDFVKWRKSLGRIDYCNDELIAEIIAVLSQAIRETMLNKGEIKEYPREAQLLSLLALLKSPKGGLAQIATGEGKTVVIAMLAAIKALEGRQVDIITSSGVLARRDVRNSRAFYRMFDIGVDHNIETKKDGRARECYGKDVVYGDILNFNGDGLRDVTGDIKMGRGNDVLIVDEVDNMFIDQNNMKVQLSGEIPGMETVNQLLVYMLGAVKRSRSMLFQHRDPNRCYLKMKLDDKQREELLKRDSKLEIKREGDDWVWLSEIEQSCGEVIEDHLINHTRKDLFGFDEHIRRKRVFIVPSHLEGIVEEYLPYWVEMLKRATSGHQREGVNYLLDEAPEDGIMLVVPVDIGNGVLLHNLQWTDGLQQFLQIKHGIAMSTESVMSIFMSYYGYFNKYRGRIYGVTGTLGTKWHHEFLREVYGVELSIIPTFAHKDVTELRAIVAKNGEEWRKEIIENIKRIGIKQQRSVLVVVETIEQVEEMRKELLAAGYRDAKIFTYGIGGGRGNEFDVNRALEEEEVVIATNLAGRGTDIRLSPEILARGGLHVIATTISRSKRIGEQIYGRTARQGEPGSIQVIVNAERYRADYGDENGSFKIREGEGAIDDLYRERDQREEAGLKRDCRVKLPYLEMLDRLFAESVDLARELDSPSGYRISVEKPGEEGEGWKASLYGEGGRIKLRIWRGERTEDRATEDRDITDLIREIEPRAAKHIGVIVGTIGEGGENGGASLNKKDLELIHFILAEMGYSRKGEVYGRVGRKYRGEVAKRKMERRGVGEKEYLKELLAGEEFRDLREIGSWELEELLEKVKRRKRFLLWLKDRKTHNHEYEIRQLNEYWGYWLRRVVDPFKEGSGGREEEQEKRQEREKRIWDDFAKFKLEMRQKFNGDGFIQNPNYYVLKGWQKVQVYYEDPDSTEDFGVREDDDAWWGLGREKGDVREPLREAEELLNRAIGLDDVYAWTAHNLRAYVKLIKDGAGIRNEEQAEEANEVNKNFYEETVKAIKGIEEVVIAGYEKQLTVLAAQEMVELDSELTIQLVAYIEFYKKIVEVLGKNLESVRKASQDLGIVVAEEVVDADKMIEGINITERILEGLSRDDKIFAAGYKVVEDVAGALNGELNGKNESREGENQFTKVVEAKQRAMLKRISQQVLLHGGILIETGVYKLEPRQENWFGTIFSAIIGVAFICVGVLLAGPAAGIFVNVMAGSMVCKGIGDIISSAISFGTGNPIDLGNYLQSTAVSMGIAIVTAGVLSFADKMMNGIKALDVLAGRARDVAGNIVATKLATNAAGFIAEASVTQAAITAASVIAYDVAGRKLVNPENIRERAQEGIEDIIGECRNELKKIFAGGKLGELYERINRIVDQYLDRFNGIEMQFASGVPIGVVGHLCGGSLGAAYGIGSILQTAVDMTKGVIKNAEAMPEIVKESKRLIREMAAQVETKWEMMEKKIRGVFKGEEGAQLIGVLKEQGYVKGGEVDCGELAGVNLEKLELTRGEDGYKRGLLEVCREVDHELTQEYDYSGLRENFIGIVGGAINYIRKDLARVGSQGVATLVVNLIDKGIREKSEAKKIGKGKLEPEPEKKRGKEREQAKRIGERLEKIHHAGERVIVEGREEEEYSREVRKGLERVREGPQVVGEQRGGGKQAGGLTKLHVVKSGESLYRIAAQELGQGSSARAAGVMVNELIKQNPELGANPDLIKVGQVIRVPVLERGVGADRSGGGVSEGVGSRGRGGTGNQREGGNRPIRIPLPRSGRLFGSRIVGDGIGIASWQPDGFKLGGETQCVGGFCYDGDQWRVNDPIQSDRRWLEDIGRDYSSPELFSRDILGSIWSDSEGAGRVGWSLDDFFSDHPRIGAIFETLAEHAEDEARRIPYNAKYQQGLAVGLGKEALETAESISGFAWDVCKWLGRVGKYGVTHPGESIDQMGEWSWEALQWSIYAWEHPGEALAFSAEVFKQSKEPVVSWAKSEWGRITANFKEVFGGGGENPYRAGLSAGKLGLDITMMASIGSVVKGLVVKGGKALLTTAVDRGLIKGAGALSAAEKTKLVTTAERVGSEVVKSGRVSSSGLGVSGQKQAVMVEFKLTEHAKERMIQRGIKKSDIEIAMKNEPFEYLHKGEWKNGFYDVEKKVFIAQSKSSGKITTVINNVKQNYIENLKKMVAP